MSLTTTLVPLLSAPEPGNLKIAIGRVNRRIKEVEGLDPSTVDLYDNRIAALQASIDESLTQIFGAGNDRYRRYRRTLDWAEDIPSFGSPRDLTKYREDVAKGCAQVLTMLGEAKRALEEWMSELGPANSQPVGAAVTPTALNRKVFIVHGHDELPREAVARYLEALDFEVIILNERASRNKTIIEKIEANADVGFAVVLLTPDDEGAKKGAPAQPRARQNVLLELGYFMAKLGRDRVCAIMRDKVEVPTDFAGVVWVSFDSTGAWKTALAKELDVHFQIDWNKAMRR